jgi:hypothetical protein
MNALRARRNAIKRCDVGPWSIEATRESAVSLFSPAYGRQKHRIYQDNNRLMVQVKVAKRRLEMAGPIIPSAGSQPKANSAGRR